MQQEGTLRAGESILGTRRECEVPGSPRCTGFQEWKVRVSHDKNVCLRARRGKQ